MVIKAYLILYNLLSAAGWAYVLYTCVDSLQKGVDAEGVWKLIAEPLSLVQSTMMLEILHALAGLVRSPVMVTLMQVMSRIVVLWGATYWVPECQAHWSLYLMVIAWALVEVTRYLFYASNLATGTSPYPLFWLRYSFFMILYPAGITGELFQLYTSLPHWAQTVPVWQRILMLLMMLYIPGSPGMIGNMWRNRKNAFKKRNAKPRPLDGLVWPLTKKGDRSTTSTNKAIWAAAVEAVDTAAANAVRKEKNWRFGYLQHVERNVRLSLASGENAIKIAEAGLKEAHDRFEFVRDGETMKFSEAMERFTGSFELHTIRGAGAGDRSNKPTLKMPYGGKSGKPYYLYKNQRNDILEGEGIKAQLKRWVELGVIEADCAEAIGACVDNPEWMDLSKHHFILLGAGSAMGPLELLLSLGANVYAVDLDRPVIWESIFAKTRASRGTVHFPVKAGTKGMDKMSDKDLAKISGASLTTHTPEIANWLTTHVPPDNICIGNYTYLDGALHVQLSLACDAIIAKLAQKRPNLAIAFLCTPTDCHPITKSAYDAARANQKKAPLWQSISPLLTSNVLKPEKATDTKEDVYLVDGVVSKQGTSYILAKRLQHWRAIVERSRGHTISSNVAPSTATVSVVHNASFAAAYGGMHHFKPMEVMYQETSKAVMGALLIHDVRNPKAPANPKALKLANPIRMFEYGSFHGGVWRCAFKMDSMGEMSVIAFYLREYWLSMTASTAGAAAVVAWVLTGQVGPIAVGL